MVLLYPPYPLCDTKDVNTHLTKVFQKSPGSSRRIFSSTYQPTTALIWMQSLETKINQTIPSSAISTLLFPSTMTSKFERKHSSTDKNHEAEKWGTHVMGHPAPPTAHPNNQKAALWSGQDHHPYVQFTPVDKPSNNPAELVVHVFSSWTNKADTLARNIWQNLKTGSSVSEAAWGKVGLTAKAVTGGGFEALFKQTFNAVPNEKLKKTFACYLSTSTGPVAGTMYLSNIHVAFCSDRPLSFTAPSDQETWCYYKLMIPLANIRTVNPVIMGENPPEKYIQVTTTDEHEFWFMGFVNFEKASVHLQKSLREFAELQRCAHPGLAVAEE